MALPGGTNRIDDATHRWCGSRLAPVPSRRRWV